MTGLKKILFIFISFAILAVVGISIIALSIIKSDSDIAVSYTDPLILTQEFESSKTQTQTQLSKWVTNIKQKTGENLIFDSWQNSDNIKHADYIPRIIANNQSQKVADVIATNITESKSPAEESYSQWSWTPKKSRAPKTTTVPTKSSEDLAIINYGNSLGAEVQTFAATVGDQPKIMADFMAGSGQPNNKDGLLLLSKRYTDLGDKLSTLGSAGAAPNNIKELGLNLANAYTEVGLATRVLAESETVDDAATIESIYTYHKSVDAFVTHFIAFSNILVAYGAEFKQGEGGDIFMPPMQ